MKLGLKPIREVYTIRLSLLIIFFGYALSYLTGGNESALGTLFSGLGGLGVIILAILLVQKAWSKIHKSDPKRTTDKTKIEKTDQETLNKAPTKNEIIIVLLCALLIFGFLFYWYEYRPTKIKKGCATKAAKVYGDEEANWKAKIEAADIIYFECLRRKGL